MKDFKDYQKFREIYTSHLDWAIQNLNLSVGKTQDEWDELKYNVLIHLLENNNVQIKM